MTGSERVPTWPTYTGTHILQSQHRMLQVMLRDSFNRVHHHRQSVALTEATVAVGQLVYSRAISQPRNHWIGRMVCYGRATLCSSLDGTGTPVVLPYTPLRCSSDVLGVWRDHLL